jgi:hypothetical protein
MDDLFFVGVCAVLLMVAVAGLGQIAHIKAESEEARRKNEAEKPLRPGEWAPGRQVTDGTRMLSVQSGRAVRSNGATK